MEGIKPQTRTQEIASLYDLKKEVMLTMLEIGKVTIIEQDAVEKTIESFRETLKVIDRKLSTLKA